MRFRVVKDKGAKPWALIVEENGVQIEKRDYATQAAAEKGRTELFEKMGII